MEYDDPHKEVDGNMHCCLVGQDSCVWAITSARCDALCNLDRTKHVRSPLQHVCVWNSYSLHAKLLSTPKEIYRLSVSISVCMQFKLLHWVMAGSWYSVQLSWNPKDVSPSCAEPHNVTPAQGIFFEDVQHDLCLYVMSCSYQHNQKLI